MPEASLGPISTDQPDSSSTPAESTATKPGMTSLRCETFSSMPAFFIAWVIVSALNLSEAQAVSTDVPSVSTERM